MGQLIAPAPLLLILGMLSLGVMKVTFDHLSQKKPGRPPFIEGVLLATPQALATVFSFTPSVSAFIFTAWRCVEYVDDSAVHDTRAYLEADTTVLCRDSRGGAAGGRRQS